MATSQLSTSLNSGNLAKVEAPANLGTFVPLTGCIGVLPFFYSLNYYNINYGLYIHCCSLVGCRCGC